MLNVVCQAGYEDGICTADEANNVLPNLHKTQLLYAVFLLGFLSLKDEHKKLCKSIHCRSS